MFDFKPIRQLFSFCIYILPVLAWTQNLVPNPGFELNSSCPSTYGQTYLLDAWEDQGGSPDYYNCSFEGMTVKGNPANGTGLIGFWGGAQHPACRDNGYAEYLSANLTSPLKVGENYLVRFRIQISSPGVSALPNDCMSAGIYLYNSAHVVLDDEICCKSVKPQIELKGGEVLLDEYQTFQFPLLATEAYDKILIGSFCNDR